MIEWAYGNIGRRKREVGGNAAEAKKHFEEYLKFTDAFDPKNIFVIRERENIQKELEKL